MRRPSTLFALAALTLVAVPSVHATQVKKCKPDRGSMEDGTVTISACDKPPCKLVKKSTIEVTIKFTPEKDIESLQNHVYAEIANVPFPFIGVDGKNVCDKMFKEDGVTKASCPLKAGTTYMFSDNFKVYEIYPKVKVNVHWGLKEVKTKKTIACFEAEARIL